MKDLVRCKPCGYIGEKDKMGDNCPACGALSKYFEPHKDKMKPKRRKLLNLDLHPIAVHFPQALCVFIIFFLVFGFVFPKVLTIEIASFVYLSSIMLPFAVIGAFVSGLIDGKVRFKKFKGRKLKHKIIIGSIMFVFSVIVALAATLIEKHMHSKLIILGACAISLLLAILLAQIGKKLMLAEMPG